MSLQTDKLQLIEWLAGLDDESIIENLKWLKESQENGADWWDVISNVEKASIQRGLKDHAEGRTHDHEAVRKNYEKWL